MKARPILMHARSIQNLLAGRKTQTRRTMNPQPTWNEAANAYHAGGGFRGTPGWRWCAGTKRRPVDFSWAADEPPAIDTNLCPYGKRGDLLWVRERWQYADWTEDGYPFIGYNADGARILHENYSPHWADRLQDIWAELSVAANYDIDDRAADRQWRPSIHMPRWASRLTLELTDARAARLSEISDSDCIAEGVQRNDFKLPGDTALVCYRRVWEDINGQFSWGDNPWVWALTFKVHRHNIDTYIQRVIAHETGCRPFRETA